MVLGRELASPERWVRLPLRPPRVYILIWKRSTSHLTNSERALYYLGMVTTAKNATTMTCTDCDVTCQRFGRHRNGLRRFRCPNCKKTFTDAHRLTAMPSTFQSIGTVYIGECDYVGRTYVTTEWFVLLCIPIVPLRSLRVEPATPSQAAKDEKESSAFRTRTTYNVHRILALHRPQVLRTYVFAAFHLAWVLAAAFALWKLWLSKGHEFSFASYVVLLLACIVPLFLPFALRQRARRRILQMRYRRT
jgi:hypothetical protein